MDRLDEIAAEVREILTQEESGRIRSGRLLREAHQLCQERKIAWTGWCARHGFNRQDTYKRMDLAAAENPIEAHNEAKEKNRVEQQNHRAATAKSVADVSDTAREPDRAYTPGGTLAQDFIAKFNQLPKDEQEACRALVLGFLRKDIRRATESKREANGNLGGGNIVEFVRR